MNQARLTREKQQQIEQNQVLVARQQREVEKTRLEKKRLKVFVCKRCFVKYFNNIKLHDHIRNYYTKKSKVALFTSFISFTSLVVFTLFVVFNISSQMSFILFSTLFTILFALSFAIFFSILKKLYLTMNNLFVMFVERFKSLDLLYRSRNSFFSYN